MISNYLFLLGTILISLNNIDFLGFGISDLAYLIATIIAIIETITYDRKNILCWYKNFLLYPAGMILFGGAISLIRSAHLGIAIFELAQSIYIITFFVSLTWIMVRRGLTDSIINSFIASGFLAAMIAIYDYLTNSGIGENWPIWRAIRASKYFWKFFGVNIVNDSGESDKWPTKNEINWRNCY